MVVWREVVRLEWNGSCERVVFYSGRGSLTVLAGEILHRGLHWVISHLLICYFLTEMAYPSFMEKFIEL